MSEFQRGYKETCNKLENMTDIQKEMNMPETLKHLCRNQDPMNDYDKGTEQAIIDYQHGWD